MNDRITDVYKDGEWIRKEFENIEIGERFRIFEKDGTRVTNSFGAKQWVAKGNPYQDEKGTWTVNAYYDLCTEVEEEE